MVGWIKKIGEAQRASPIFLMTVRRLDYQLKTWSRSESFTMKMTSWGGSFSFLK